MIKLLKNKSLANIIWLFFDKIVRLFGGLFVGVWVARYLGPGDYGILSYALSYCAFFLLFINLGLQEIVVREIVNSPRMVNYILGSSFVLKLSGSVIAFILVEISLVIVEPEMLVKGTIQIIVLGFVFQSLDVIDYYYSAKVLSKYIVISRNVAFLFFTLLQIYFIYNKYDVIFFAWAYTINFILSAFFMLYTYKHQSQDFRNWRFSKKISFKLLKNSWPLAISTFLISMYTNIDKVMIGNLLSISEVGIYSVAVKLCEAWYFIPLILIDTFRPSLLSLKGKNNIFFEFRLLQFYSFMFWIGLIVGITTMFLGKQIIQLLYGEIFISSYYALVFNIWNGMFLTQAMVRGIWFLSENLQRYRLFLTVPMLLLNIIVNYLLIPLYGISGAAFATVFTQAFGTWILPIFFKDLRQNNLLMLKSVNPLFLFRKYK